ncbi:MAG: excinuclease ABC subunit UvrC [Alphaproteobacteria bacterium]|nr:excinuclease ABC subunit UvrC [Alphaproteobacteria bacterium]
MTGQSGHQPEFDADGAAASAPEPDLKRGIEVIKSTAKKLTTQPGVYRMLDYSGNALYVGKAKALSKRVISYTRTNALSNRLMRMVSETVSMEIITTRTEVEALLLESNLIKTLKPRFNILLRDDKSFPYIMLTKDHDWPQLTKHRGPRKRKGEYFGPFASASAVNRTVTELTRAFMLRTCSDSIFSARSRPCLQHQIKRCSAPCVGKVTGRQYDEQVQMAARFLSGDSKKVQEEFARHMHEAAEQLEFEDAAVWRNRIRALTSIQAHQDINLPSELNADVIALKQDSGKTCVQVFFMRNGSNYGNKSYFPRHEIDDTPGHIMAAFIGQFYDDKPCPPEILVSTLPEQAELIAQALSSKADRKTQISIPSRGHRRKLMQMAERNAGEALSRELAQSSSQKKMLALVQELFDLDDLPKRIEVYDNSHIQGSHAVGGMIVAGEDGFTKAAYRKFNIIRDEHMPDFGGDDFAMMRQVLQRRFQRAMREDPERKSGVWPDLVLLDGGKGQLSAARQVMEDLGVLDVPMVAISKGPDRNAGREEFHQHGKDSFSLPLNTPVLHFLQRLRDEAHRFAIGAHRARRQKSATANPLDQIPGIGAKRKKALLSHFGSARSIARADIPDLMQVDGISKAVAETIYGWFHNAPNS